MKALGIAILLCGAFLQMLVVAGPLSSHYRNEYVKTPEMRANWEAIGRATPEQRERMMKERSKLLQRAEPRAIIIGVIVTCISLGLGFLTAVRSFMPPVFYYFISGIVPGFVIYHGWRVFRRPSQLQQELPAPQ